MNWTRTLAIIAVAVGLGLLAWRATDDRAADIAVSDGVEPRDLSSIAAAPNTDHTDDSDDDRGDPTSPSTDDSDDDQGDPTNPGTDDSDDDQGDPTTANVDNTDPEPIPVLGPVDTLTSIDGWLNTDATSLEEILAASDVTVVQFWTFGCHNCKATLPHLQAIYADYHDAGLEIVGVHAPEFAYEADPDNVAAALVDLGVPWPVALDTTKQNFHRWQPGNTGYWPRVFVVDRDGQIRFDHIGEGKYDELRNTVSQLLTEA